MTALRATFHFEIRELAVSPELFSTSHAFEHGAYKLRVTWPVEAQPRTRGPDPTWAALDGLFPQRDAFPPLDEFERRRTGLTIDMPSLPSVRVVRVECFFEGSFGVADFAGLEDSRDAPVFQTAKRALEDAGHAARDGLRALLEWVRVRGQHWLGPDAGSPRGLAYGELADLDVGRTLPTRVALEPSLPIVKIKEHQVLDASRLRVAVERVTAGTGPPVEDALRSDSLYLLQDAEPPDYPRAVLTAAMACEVKIKTLLQERASEQQRELVEIVVKRATLLQLFHRPLEAVAGVSLCDGDADLYQRLGALIKRRNEVAHGARPPEKDEAYEHVQTASDVFRWLDGIDAPQPPNH